MLLMKMNKNAVNLLGVLSFIPLLFILQMMFVPFGFVSGLNVLPFAIAAWLTWIGVFLLFLIFLIQSPNFLPQQKFLWMAILIFVGFLSMPVFWWMYFKSPQDTNDR